MQKVTCAIIIRQNKMLITQRAGNTDHPFRWEFPGGKLNFEESAENCIIREIREELEIEIGIQDSLIAVQHDYGFKQIELIPFICKIKTGEIKLNEHIDYKWISFEDLFYTDFSEADRELIELTKNEEILKKYLGKNKNDSG